MEEIDIINKMQSMCEESCSPDQFEAWESLKSHLMKTRKNLRRPTTRAADKCHMCDSTDVHTIVTCYEHDPRFD